ncbi:MAG: hypothetical protein K6T30_08785 [Alicyclobacillus sp.]|nr:hypothetical protein [Alicyclobacillus sp.]
MQRHKPLERVEIDLGPGEGATRTMWTSAIETDLVLVERRYFDALRDVVTEARVVRDGWSQVGWEEFCEALDRLAMVEREKKMAPVDAQRMVALERLYRLIKGRREAERAFDEAGEDDDAEMQAAVLPYIDYFDEEIARCLREIEGLEQGGDGR